MATVPNLNECQPRFVLYCKAHEIHEGDTWKTWEFMRWIDEMVIGYNVARGVNRRDALYEHITDHDEFTRYIETEVNAICHTH